MVSYKEYRELINVLNRQINENEELRTENNRIKHKLKECLVILERWNIAP